LRERLLRRAAEQLAQTDAPVTAIAFDLGFSSTQHFATSFRKQYGLSPTQFRRKAFL
jgi:AraC-like DNA-binding protein